MEKIQSSAWLKFWAVVEEAAKNQIIVAPLQIERQEVEKSLEGEKNKK